MFTHEDSIAITVDHLDYHGGVHIVIECQALERVCNIRTIKLLVSNRGLDFQQWNVMLRRRHQPSRANQFCFQNVAASPNEEELNGQERAIRPTKALAISIYDLLLITPARHII